MTDRVRRFAIEQQPIRGHWVRIEQCWREMRAHAQLPAPVEALLGESVAAALLLASTLKFDGLLTLQLEGDGAARLLVAQCTHDFRVRAMVRHDAARSLDRFADLVGAGRLAVTIEAEDRASRYQGIVPLTGESLSACLTQYFESSEQLPTHLRLAADGKRAGGILLQRMPVEGGVTRLDVVAAEQAWANAGLTVARLDANEMLAAPAEDFLAAFAGDADLRLFAGTPVHYQCRCSDGRVAGVLLALGRAEVEGIVAEQGGVTVTCEFCQRPYRLDAVDVGRLFAGVAVSGRSQTLN